MRRIGITPGNTLFREQRRITAWLRSGYADYFHIRKPRFSEQQLREYLAFFPSDVRQRLSLHDFHHLALELGIGGVHLNGRNPELAPGLEGKRITASCHSLEEFARKQASCAYCFVSPVFDSVSKKGYASAFSTDVLRDAFARGVLNGKAVALGGVTRDRLPLLEEIGFSAYASVGECWRLPRTMFITHQNASYSYAESARLALACGIRFVQLRMKDASDAEVLAVAEQLRPECDARGALLTVDDRIQLLETGLFDGVHVGKKDMPVPEAKRITGDRYLLGATCNTVPEALQAAADGADYLGVGPFRFTETKKNLAPVLGLEGYVKVMRALRHSSLPSTCSSQPLTHSSPSSTCPSQPLTHSSLPSTCSSQPTGEEFPVYAIGGIVDSDLEALKSTGVHGVAISGVLLGSEDPHRVGKQFLKHFE